MSIAIYFGVRPVMNTGMNDGKHGLVGAMDLTGNPDDGEGMYLAIIIGRENYLQVIVDSIGHEKIHMRLLSRKDKRAVQHKLKLDRKDCVAICLKIDRNSTVNAVLKMRRVKKTYAARSKVLRAYHCRLMSLIANLLKNFPAKHNVLLSDIVN